MKLLSNHSYFVFPGYGIAFRNMTPWLTQWENAFDGEHQFWHGFSGGGILAVPNTVPRQMQYRLAINGKCHLKPVYGTALGNGTGQRLARLLACAAEDRPPRFAVKLGAEPVPDPTVKTTPEHLALKGDERVLLVVPQAKRKTLKKLENLPEWFKAFGVDVDMSPYNLRQAFGDDIASWFSDPTRTMFVFRMFGGEDNAAWQTAVTYYVAEYWDTQVRGLDSLHFAANIDGQPCFRKNWTSNK